MNKEEQYKELVANVKAIIEGETDMIAIMSNVAAEIHQTMKFWWTGFYRVKDGELILGPFQGPIACIHIVYVREEGRNHYCARCGTVPRTYRMQ